ncbi:hypothetical protein M9Y10_007276 [Tritrichomonas musculus]|uniref:Actin n=1 Tax=Tritrichomonas musculus TaxID=1915356 RepID=A0ABR2J1W4_9EUKA
MKNNEKISNDNEKLTKENTQLKKDNEKISNDNEKLTKENTQLKKDNEKISNDNEKLTKENTQLKKDNEKISNDNEKLTKENAQLKKDNKKANNDDKKLTEKEHKDKKKKHVHDTPKISKIPKVSPSATTEIKYKQTLIIDNGSGCIRSGFASNELPKSIFPTIVGRTKNACAASYSNDIYVGNEACSKADALVLKRPIERGIITNWDDIEKIWHHAFYNELHVDPSEHPVLLTEAPLNPKQNREKMIQIMFETFNVPSFYVINQAVLSLYSTGRTIGIVLNSGYDITHAVPINNYIIPHATTSIPLAGNELTIWLQEILKERGYTFKTSSEKEIVVDIKEKHGYVVLDYISELQKARSSSKYDVFYTLPNKTGITIGDELFRCPELLFKPLLNGYEFDGIDKILFDSIMKCDINVRKDMYSNIVLSGGTTMFEGLEERIEKEMMNMAPPAMRVKVRAPPERKHAAFIGGSILASLTTFHQMMVTNDEYNDVGPAIVHQKCH